VELLSSGRVEGVLSAPSFSLADGCVFDGRWETTRRPSLETRVAPDAAADESAEPASAP
jgi:cytoskeletal protein CcmA (bactofilin family)